MSPSALLIVGLSLLAGSLAASSPLPVLLACAPILVCLLRRGEGRLVLAALGCLVLGLARASLAVDRFEVRRVMARDALGAPARCAGEGVIVASPTLVRDAVQLQVEFEQLDCEGHRVNGPILTRLYGGSNHAGRGDRLRAVMQLAPLRLFRNADLPNPVYAAAVRGVLLSGSVLAMEVVATGHGWRRVVDRAREHARSRIVATFSPAAAALGRALVLGENDLSDEDGDAFRRSGLAHLLAVSGTHLVFAVVALVRALSWALARIERLAATVDAGRLSAAAGVGLALLYADFAGGSGSAWRAAWMLTAGFTVRVLGRHPDAHCALGASLVTGSVVEPLAAFDVSFVLSALATGGLLVFNAPLATRARCIRHVPLRLLALSLTATTSAMVPCAPLLALLGPTLSIAGLFANVLAAPVGETAALPLCLAHTLLWFWPGLERGVALAASGALLVVRQVAQFSAALGWAAVTVPPPGAWHLALLGTCAGLLLLTRSSLRRGQVALCLVAAALGLAAIEIGAVCAGRPRALLRVTVVDVAQGDALLVDLPDGSLMLIDGGGFVGSPVDPGRAAILPLLRARRRDRIDVAVLTHAHPDHLIGLRTVLGQVKATELWTSIVTERQGATRDLAEWLADLRRSGVRVLGPGQLCNRPHTFGHASVRVLGPCPGPGDGRGLNDNSLVLQVRFGRRAALLPGDAERLEESELVRAYGSGLKADLLKAGHHGSRTSTSPEFLSLVRPSTVVISSGVRNRFGHPHALTLDRLTRAGVSVARTDRMGSVVWQTDGESVSVRTFSEPR
ncbi:MAG: ComEC/Rec2 family competence protein [Polyangiaceae bacterium]|nr:ComEC/Rec2 family competence protein [Polyangiaceae bacterium]